VRYQEHHRHQKQPQTELARQEESRRAPGENTDEKARDAECRRRAPGEQTLVRPAFGRLEENRQ
jgi:hypothetical protein